MVTFSNIEATGAIVPLPDLLYELSLGEVIIILIVVALVLLVLVIERTEAAAAKARLYQPAQSLIMKDCPARFGFLQRLPRGGTIPEECYVCAQLVECLGFQRNPRK